ncbi:MAG: hypothetical protein OXI76_14680 [Gemmatimonadota bacterium]|nr:hypothetical protein [Gemmatimonadota bacterium]
MLSRLRILLLAAAICACSPAPDSPASKPDATPAPAAPPDAAPAPAAPPEAPPPADPGALWIAVTNRAMSGSDYHGMLVPIARHLDGSWDNVPWAGIFDLSGPGPGIEAVKTGDGVWSWPDASQYWDHPGRAADTLGRAPEVIATGVPRSWFLYSPSEQGLPLSTTGLAVTPAHCSHRWAIRTDLEAPPERDALGGYGPPAIALTRTPAAVLSENDIPGLDEIRRNLGFADIAEGRKGDRSFYWLGLFRFENIGPESAGGGPRDATLGVLWGQYYEGADYTLIQIDGQGSRVLMTAYEGGC